MKKYRSKNEILVWQWTGDKSIVTEIKDVLKEHNNDHVEFDVALSEDEQILEISTKHGYSTGNEFVYKGQYIIFNIDDYERPFGCYNGEWLNKKFVEI